MRRNYEQNPEAVRRWIQEQYPAVAHRAKEQGAEIYWGDETGVRNDCAHGRGFSPKAKTPVANNSSKRFSTNMISSVTNLRTAMRATHSAPTLRRLRLALTRLRPCHLPQSTLGKANTYCLEQWLILERFVSDEPIDIDNNRLENAIRPTALGKKQWLFIGEPKLASAKPSSTPSSRVAGDAVDPLAYLREVLTRLPSAKTSQIAELTPEAYEKAQRPASISAQAV